MQCWGSEGAGGEGGSVDLTSSPAQGQPCRGLGGASGSLSRWWSEVRGRGGRPGLALVLACLLTPPGLRFLNLSLLWMTFQMFAMVTYSLHDHLPADSVSQLTCFLFCCILSNLQNHRLDVLVTGVS